jgi:hypothetical protein
MTITSSPTTITGTLTVNTASSIGTYSGIKFTAAGSYTLTASMTSVTSGTYTVTLNSPVVTLITISTSSTIPSAYTAFTITFNIYDQDNNVFTSSATVTLTSSTTILGTLTLTTSTGTGSMIVYSSTVGSNTITATCSGKTDSKTVDVKQNKITITSVTPSVRTI